MNIKTVIQYLNKQQGYDLDSEYYTRISQWRDWWQGYHLPFHQFKEQGSDGVIRHRDMYTLKMAKKVCEDWASILLNEKTQIVIDDEASSEFVQGEDGTGGIFAQNDFWVKANALVEKAFYSGTGAFVLRLEGMKVQGETVLRDSQTQIRLEYLPAMNIIPLTVKQGRIVEVAFVSEVLQKGKHYIYLETHQLVDGGYLISNQYFEERNDILSPVPLPPGIAEQIRTGSSIPLFAIVEPNIVNNIDNNLGLGLSVFANALDNLKGVDLAFNNFCRDLKLGGKKVFLNKALTELDDQGKLITPDDVAQQLFITMGDEAANLDAEMLIHEFNPDLRTEANKEAIQGQLDYLSFKCGLGTKHYQFNAGNIVTATQYMGDKQELIQNASKHYISIERALQDIVKAILWAGAAILGQTVQPEARVSVNFDDSYVIDKESERLRDQQEIRDGIMQKWEYRVKWYGEDEATAKKMAGGTLTDDQLLFGGGDA